LSNGVCPLTAASRLLSRKWSLVIIYYLLQGSKSFSELEKSIKGISPKTLAETLEELADLGLVHRIVDPGPPVRVRYRLTEAGKDLDKVIHYMTEWACKWLIRDDSCSRAPTTARLVQGERGGTSG